MIPLALALALCAAPLSPRTPAPQDPPAEGEELQRLEAWPELERDTLETVRTDIARLRKAHTPEMGEEAQGALIRVGAGIVPELLPALGKEREEEARARIELVLTRVTDARHTRLLAAEFESRALEVRVFCLSRVSAFPDPGVRAAADAAWARVAKAGAKADARERFAAALCAASAGSVAGFDELAQRAEKRWAEDGAAIRAALAGSRGPEAAEKAVALLGGKRGEQVAGLNLLSACGTRDNGSAVRPFLDSDDNQLRVAAINAARGMVDGEGPLDKLPVFEAIELAAKWKNRL